MKTVEVDQLKPGMILAKSVINSNFIVLFLADTVLNDKQIILLKKMQIPSVEVKDEYDNSKLFQQLISVRSEDESFAQSFRKITKTANKIFAEIKIGGEIKSAIAILAAKILPMADNPASINYLFNIGYMNATLVQHCERVAIFAGVISKWMGLGWDEIRVIVTAAFLHDVGKLNFPPQFLYKDAEDLKGADLELYKTHCQLGRDMLVKLKLPEPIPTAVFQHHENMNGSGFPQGIRGKDIHLFAKIIAVADAYDKLISERPGFRKQTPFDAITFFARSQYSRFDPKVCMPMLTRMKDHLIGSHVKLLDGRQGRVIFYPKDFTAMPVIRFDEDHMQVDLNKRPELSIVQYSIK